MYITTVFIIVLTCVLIYHLLGKKPEVKAGVYRLPGKWYWLKRVVFYILFHLRSAKRKRESQADDVTKGSISSETNDIKGYGKGDRYLDMEKPQTLTSSVFAIDCCYFVATNKDGCNIVCRMARRHNRSAEVWLFLEIPEIGCLQFPRHPDTDVYYTDGKSFSAGGLKFEILEPMKRWKLTFSGKLRRGLCTNLSSKQSDYVETSFSFIWSAFSQPFNFDTDMACSVLGDSVAREEWTREFFKRLKDNHQSHYEQWGELRGSLNVEGHGERELHLQSARDHSYGERDWRKIHRYIIHFIYLETGMSIQVGIFCQPNLMSHVKMGYVSYANGDIVSVSDVSLNLWEVAEDSKEPPASWTFSFTADHQIYNVKATGGTTPVWYHHEDRGGKVMEVFTTFEINSVKGRGISEYFYRNSDGPVMTVPPTVQLVKEPSDKDVKDSEDKLTLPFTSPACSSPLLVGGKGAQLAQLTSVQKDVNASVPSGFCVTLRSFEMQLQSNPKIVESIQDIVSTAVSDLTSLSSKCSTAVKLISDTEICQEVKMDITKSLHNFVGSDFEETHFAVRSSAAGEDGTEASSAGQMDTLLGVVGLSQILQSVRTCWASAYTAQAVEYRRQHGQPVRVLVGVVIQKMVPAESAGVMFTADPITGSNSHIVINANFGLGESVVSGKSDPDTIYVDRDPEFLHESSALKIGQVRIGGKEIQIVETGTGGIREKAQSGNTSSICLSDKMILGLATVGIELEKRFGSSRDIEWAVVGEDIYLLQCRPITVAESETEEELIHEFDSPMTCEALWLTTANISEMMPGAVTPLTLSTFMTSIEYSLQTLQTNLGGKKQPTHLPKCLPCHSNHLFICLLDIGTVCLTAMFARKDVAEISLLGNTLPELKVQQIQNYLGRSPGLVRRFLNFISMMRVWSKASSLTAEWEKKIKNYEVGKEAKTAEQLYNCIDSQLVDYETVWVWTLINSGRSGNMATILMSVIGGQADDWTSDHYGDIALLLSHCQDVYSAEVPHAIENIAEEISKAGHEFVEKFQATPDQDCMSLLNGHPHLAKAINGFLERHGHRCLRESELREKSWQSAPEKLMSVLKIMLKTKSFEKRKKNEISTSDLLGKMKTKLSFSKRWILKALLPRAWKAVGAREWGKSVSIQMSEIFKLAYARLATVLHKEGRLPDPDLMYFLTHQEIGILLSTRSAKLIIKAQKRRKVMTKQAKLKFEKINITRPEPINSGSKATFPTTTVDCLQGMPVSQGQVTGPAKVVHSLEEAFVIQAGDILVVNSTDVGWSPYFPLIGGLVTELGGLISHGAVVAREYGIPCVVNVANATSIIKSGETIELDGRMGVLKRLDMEK